MKKRGKMKSIRMNNLGVSVMISYVILISIGIALSIGVYIWLVDYANVDGKIDCKADTSLVVKQYIIEQKPAPDNNRTINLTIKNNGLFNISGFFITLGDDAKTIPKTPALEYYPDIPQLDAGFYDFEFPLGPGKEGYAEFRLDDLDKVETMQLQPFIYNEDGTKKIYCEHALIRENVLINPILIPGLVSWFKFDGRVLDANEENDGVIEGNPFYVDGKLGKGMKFDGEDDYVNTNINAELSGDITLSVWAKISFINSIGDDYIVGRNLGGYNNGDFGLYFDEGTDKIVFFIQDGINIEEAISNDPVPDTDWHHYIALYNSTGLYLFVDGVKQSDVGASITLPIHGSETVGIGAESGITPGGFFNGSIDDVAIYNKALTEWEILQLYESYPEPPASTCDDEIKNQGEINVDCGGPCSACGLLDFPSLVSLWKFEDNLDDSGLIGGNDGICTYCPGYVDGKSGKAIEFDNDRVDIAHSSSLTFGGYIDSYSFSLFVKATNPAPIGARIIEKRDGSTSYPISMQVNNPSNNNDLGNYIYQKTPVNFPGNTILGTKLWDGNWHHIVFVVDSSTDKLYSYLDGDIYTTDDNTITASTDNDHTLFIGSNFALNRNFTGSVDEIAIFNKALSDAEVLEINNSYG